MTGPPNAAGSSRGGTRPLAIAGVYLVEAQPLLEALRARGVAIGVATSVTRHLWDVAELYPTPTNLTLTLTPQRRDTLTLFSTSPPLG
jgi:hypothetical protein